MEKNLLLEMPIYTHAQVTTMSPVVEVSTNEVEQLENQGLLSYVLGQIQNIQIPVGYTITMRNLNDIYRHHVVGRNLRKAAMLSLPYVINAQYIIEPWRKSHDKPQQAGMLAAPILIDGKLYICCLTILRNADKIISPYALTLKDKQGNIIQEKVNTDVNVHSSNENASAFGSQSQGNVTTSQDGVTPLNESLQNPCQTTGQQHITEHKRYDDMKKQTIRLNESQLKRMIAEAINELDWKTYANAGKKAGHGGDISTQREINPNGAPKDWFNDAVNARQRADKFYKKASEQFDKDYGYQNGDMWGDDDTSTKVGMGGSFTSSEEFAPHAVGYRSKGYGNPRKYEHGWESYAGEKTPEEFFGDDEAATAYANADSEIKNYQKGNYGYDNERGWYLKDNKKLEESIKRSIRKYLR